MTPLAVFFKTLSRTSALFLGAAWIFLHPPLEWSNTRAVTALKSPSQMAIDGLAAALNDPDPNVRREAATALNGWRRASERQSDPSVRELVQQLSATDATARTKAACALRERDGEAGPALDALIGLLGDDTPVDQSVCGDRWRRGNRALLTTPGEQAASALVALGGRSFDPLLKTMKHTSAPARRNAAWALGALDDSRAVAALVAALEDTDAGVREQVAWALGAIGDRAAVEGLIRALRDREPRVREQAAWALGAIGDNRATDALLPLLKDPNVDVRRQAAWAIGAIGG